MRHLLLTNAFAYKKRKLVSPPFGFVYNKQVGAWLDDITGQLLVLNKEFPSVATKKEDIETGEDQKGQ